MVRPSRTGYLGAVDSTEQALFDIKAHQVAVISGMEAAIKGVLSQLAPEVLESQMEARGIGSFLKGRKARYWETYEKMYAQISDQAEKDFHELFSREFAREYQAQLERLK
jgi:type VI secretion system protein